MFLEKSTSLSMLYLLMNLAACEANYTNGANGEMATGVTSLASGSYDPSTSMSMAVDDSSPISGTSLTIPLGAFDSGMTIDIFEGESLVSESFLAEIGLSNGATAAGPSIVIESSMIANASSPLTLRLPFTLPSLALAGCNASVMYRSIDKDKENQTTIGILPNSDVSSGDGYVEFSTIFFGAYQAICTVNVIVEPVKVQSSEPIVKKVDKSVNPFIGYWTMDECEPRCDNCSGDNDNGAKSGRLTIAETTFSHSEIEYSDSECKSPTLSTGMRGELKLSGVRLPSGGYPFDIKALAKIYTPLSADMVSKLNSIAACDKSDWEIGKGFSTTVECDDDFHGDNNYGDPNGNTNYDTGGNYDGNTPGPNPSPNQDDSSDDEGGGGGGGGPQIGTTFYTALKTGATTDEVYLAKESETLTGESAEKRPVDFTSAEVLTRIK